MGHHRASVRQQVLEVMRSFWERQITRVIPKKFKREALCRNVFFESASTSSDDFSPVIWFWNIKYLKWRVLSSKETLKVHEISKMVLKVHILSDDYEISQLTKKHVSQAMRSQVEWGWKYIYSQYLDLSSEAMLNLYVSPAVRHHLWRESTVKASASCTYSMWMSAYLSGLARKRTLPHDITWKWKILFSL